MRAKQSHYRAIYTKREIKTPSTLQNKVITPEAIEIMIKFMKDGWSLLYSGAQAGLGHVGSQKALTMSKEIQRLHSEYQK